MVWVAYSLLSAVSLSVCDSLTKKVSLGFDSYFLLFTRLVFSAPILLILLFFIDIPNLDRDFYFILVMTCLIQIVADVLYVKSIAGFALSVVSPLLTFTPVFMVFVSYLLLNEVPSMVGLVGILFVVAGSYLLHMKSLKFGILTPIVTILKNKGCIFMLIVAFLYSITATLGKILVIKTSPLFISAIYFPLITVLFFPMYLLKSKTKVSELRENHLTFLCIGISFSLMTIFHTCAIILTIAPNMISIKRTSSLFNVLFGFFIFREKDIGSKFIGTAVMIVGSLLIVLF